MPTVALLLLHPIYYLSRFNRLTPLVSSEDIRIPALRTMMAAFTDLNIGLAVNAPILLLGMAVVVTGALRDRELRLRALLAVISAALFLVAFAQAPNVNSGGTPGLSRYALWLIPLPLLCWPRSQHATLSRGAIALVCLSAIWSVIFFRPSVPEQYLEPTAIAQWVWTEHPSWENPLPEIFAERLRHKDGVNTLAATSNCAKVLLQSGEWPRPCLPPGQIPAACSSEGALCYGNRDSNGRYGFVVTSRRGGIRLEARP